MGFLKANSKFPPTEWEYWMYKYDEYAAWYSGEPNNLLQFYVRSAMFPDVENGLFWSRIERQERANIIHLPAAGDVASTSANLLFSESPRFNYDEKASGGDRIKLFMKENGFVNMLLEGAEISSALSGCFLKLDIEPELVKIPILSIVTPMQCFPTFWRGRLWEVLFFRVVKYEQGDSVVWRLFENRRRENSQLVIEYALYKGTKENVGREMEINSLEELANVKLERVVYNMQGLGCVYVPNMRPNKLMPNSALGINDFSSCISLLDSLDFAWTSWMRDIELGMGQLLVDEDLLERDPNSTSAETMNFNKFQKAFMKLDLSQWRMGGENVKPIEIVQFELRVTEHAQTCDAIFKNIVTQCGYAPQSFGYSDEGNQAESGKALRIRERKSLLTREKKARYWTPALWELFYQMQQMDQLSGLSTSYQIQEVDVELEDSIIADVTEVSETIRNLDQARAVSIYTKVKMLHPYWDEKDITNEVNLIIKEQGLAPSPFDDIEV